MEATIKAIEGRSVHQIQAGQVIVDLNSVVKELVENSLDAGASSIEVRFKNNGLEGIEVQDNGTGISPADYASVALKHQTSKLASYGDLDTLQTFGFRGEALSSLCAVARVSVITARKEDGARGARLLFEASGQLKSTTVTAAQKGTLVSVEGLFEKLPVRRRELEKNIKREYGKVLGLLHAYACVSTGVRFAVSNHAAKGKKAVVFSTKANPTTRENIANVYGAKTLAALIPLDLDLEMTPTSTASASSASHTAVHIAGHISRPVVGEGRQTPDRQLFFVNSRPCALPQVSKAVNEVYKSFNVTQSPFVFADLRLDTAAYDVNVSPDKRTILLHDQTALLDALKDALVKLFEAHDQSVPQAQSQLGGARKGASSQFKPLSFVKQTSSSLTAREAEAERATPIADADADDDDGDEDEEAPPDSSAPVERNGSSISLIQQFSGRNATDRSLLPARKPSASKSRTESPDTQCGADETTQMGRQQGRSLRILEQNDASAMDVDEDGDNDNATLSAPHTPVPLPRPVQDFNARLASQQQQKQQHRLNLSPPPAPHTPSAHPLPSSTETETPITALAPPSSQRQTSPKPLINAFDRMRPKRTPASSETATITIGDKTTTLTIGAPPSYKKRRIHTPKYDLDGGVLPSPVKGKCGARGGGGKGGETMGGFMSALRAFAAPGTQGDDEEEISGSEDEGRERLPWQARRRGEDGEEEEEEEGEVEEEENAEEASKSASPALNGEPSRKEAQGRIFPDDSDSTSEPDERSDAPIHRNHNHRHNKDRDRDNSPLFVQQDEGEEDEEEDARSDHDHDHNNTTHDKSSDHDGDDEYIDPAAKKAQEDARVAAMIAKAEEATAARSEQDTLRRATNALKGGSTRKGAPLRLVQRVRASGESIERAFGRMMRGRGEDEEGASTGDGEDEGVGADKEVGESPEERLSLTVSKGDFARMRVVGQFNKGFILAVRPSHTSTSTSTSTSSPISPTATTATDDELFIIDQHASDEKANFERLASSTILEPQRLVRPLQLDLTAVEEEIIQEHRPVFAANGFLLDVDTSGDVAVGQRCRLLGLPVSRETVFGAGDLEELVALLGDTEEVGSALPSVGGAVGGMGGGVAGSGTARAIPRPSKVRTMLASRACRSSIMVGKTLTTRQMQAVLHKMGSIDKPWNCPHGRPTMRHLARLGEWRAWREGEGVGCGEEGLAGMGGREVEGARWEAFVGGRRDGGV